MGLRQFVEQVSKHGLMPYQKELLNAMEAHSTMLNSLPAGHRLFTHVNRRGRREHFAVSRETAFRYVGDGEWEPSQ